MSLNNNVPVMLDIDKVAVMLNVYILAVDTLTANSDKKTVLKDAMRRSLTMTNRQRGEVAEEWGQLFWDAIQELKSEADGSGAD